MNRSAPVDSPWPLEDGERVLWEGAPDATPTKDARALVRRGVVWAVIAAALFAALLVWRLGFGGVGGWMAGIVLGLFAVFHAVVPWGLFILAEEPWRFRRGARCVRYLVSDRRTWHMLSSPSPNAGRTAMLPLLDGGGLPWKPVVRRAGSGRSDLFFRPLPGKTFDPERVSKRNATGFLDLSDADVPAALAALEELRNSAAR